MKGTFFSVGNQRRLWGIEPGFRLCRGVESNIEARAWDDTKNTGHWIELKPLRADYEPLILMMLEYMVQYLWCTMAELSYVVTVPFIVENVAELLCACVQFKFIMVAWLWDSGDCHLHSGEIKCSLGTSFYISGGYLLLCVWRTQIGVNYMVILRLRMVIPS